MAVDDLTISLPEGISQRQVADAVGISISTVSRTLSGHPRVSSRTRSDVLRAIDRLSRNAVPDNGRPVRRVIGLTQSLAIDGPANRGIDIILEQVLGGAETAARQAGYMLYTLQNSYSLRSGGGQAFFDEVRGVISAGGLVSRPLIDAFRQRRLPTVIIGGHLPDSDVPSVAANSAEGVRQATRHLIDLGHRRIGLVNGPTDTYTSMEKKAGYLSALVDAGITPDIALIRWHDGPFGFDAGDAMTMTGELLDLEQRPTAILFANDSMAVSGMSACRARRLTVPDDISIVGFHDDADARLASPQMTTVRVDRLEWGAAAVRRVLDALDNGSMSADRLLLPTELVVRDSTARPPA
ncbi:MAG: LacI family DNA-binding transcriptional regulator [Chloroflexia bacterium]|nr:LacI family DNA-binding transcriptional regulator [Chloroflexia bacterium]